MNKFKSIFSIFLFACVLSVCTASAQTVIKGSVKDQSGSPIIGAAVMVAGTSNGTVTDVEGNYTLQVKPKSDLKIQFSSIGYISATVSASGRNIVDVVLEEDTEELEEVVVVGYGYMKKSDITGSVTSVKIDETQASQSASLDQLLQGHAAGVQVISNSAAPDAGVSVLIRGASSFNSNSQPLYVVDGVILNTDSSASVGSHQGMDNGIDEDNNGLMGINPSDIESMEILKDASATAIYGSQGANGVVLITTKSAKREKPSITFSAGVSIANIYKKFDLLNASDYITFLDRKGIAKSDQSYLVFTERIADGSYEAMDWQDYSTRTSITQRYYLTIAGKPKQTSYRFSMGYNGYSGVIKGTGYDNITMRLNLEKTIRKFKMGTNTSFSYLNTEMTQAAGGTIKQSPSTSMIMSMLLTRPVRRVLTEDMETIEDETEVGPDRWLNDYQSKRVAFRITPSLYAQYSILPWLTLKTSLGADYRSDELLKFKSRRINMQSTGSAGAITQLDRINWNWDNMLLFNKQIKKHSISGTLGQSMFMVATKNQTVEGTNVEQWKAMSSSLNSAPYTWLSYNEGASQILSFFARAVYNYGNRYVFTGTYRFDGSSKFSGANKWAQFPSFAFAWKLNNEPWFKVPVISEAKLRFGWGRVGNQGIPAYQTVYRYSTGIYATHDNPEHVQTTMISQNIPTKELKWETTSQFNGGIDMGFFHGRLTFSLDAYYKLTEDLLQMKILSGSAGVDNPYVNMGAISNRGLEFTLNAVPIHRRKIEWTVSGNITLNRNRIETIDPSGAGVSAMCLYRNDPTAYKVTYFTGNQLSSDQICHDYLNVFIAGQPMSLFYAMPTDGILQEDKKLPGENFVRPAGSVNYLDTNGDGLISSADRVIVGNPNPDFIYGFDTSFTWDGLTITAAFTGSFGNDIYNQQAAVLSDISTKSANRSRDLLTKSWQPGMTNAKYPSFEAFDLQDLTWCTDRFVEDGSYLRLANLSINYTIPIKKKDFFLKHASVGVSGKNLFVITKYSGYDPDVNIYGSFLKYGVDMGAYPSARTFMLDLKLSF